MQLSRVFIPLLAVLLPIGSLSASTKLGPPNQLNSDPCAQLNTAIQALPPTGGILDVSGVVGNQTCNVTLSITVPVTIKFGYTVWMFYGNPGINITSYGPVALQGVPHQLNYDPSSDDGTVFVSGSAAPLITDSGSTGSQLTDLELNGNGTGSFGFIGALAGGMVWKSVHVHHFRYMGIVALGGLNTFHDLLSNSNGSDGIFFASDGVMDGNCQIALNGGVGVHTIIGGARITDVDSDHNALHGIYLDGRVPPDWSGTTRFVVSTLIKPGAGNPGGYYFLSANVGGTTGSAHPAWPQQTHATVQDGSVTWVNVGTFPGIAPGNIIVNKITGGTVDDNGYGEPDGFVSDNIRIEGASPSNYSSKWNRVDGTDVQQAQITNRAVTGIHLINTQESAISNVHWLGGAWGNRNSADMGGYVVENSWVVLIDNSTSTFSARNPVKILNSTYAMVRGFEASETGASTSYIADTYCISIDARSNHTQLTNIVCDSGTGYGRGIYNGGTNTTIEGYVNSTTASSPDYLGDISYYIDDSGDATFNDISADDISTSQAGSVNTTAGSIRPGACQTYDVPINGATNSSIPLWGIVGPIQSPWQSLTVQPHVGTNKVTLYICNPTENTVQAPSATINVGVINH